MFLDGMSLYLRHYGCNWEFGKIYYFHSLMNCFLREEIKIVLYLVIYSMSKMAIQILPKIIKEGNKGINHFI